MTYGLTLDVAVEQRPHTHVQCARGLVRRLVLDQQYLKAGMARLQMDTDTHIAISMQAPTCIYNQ
eukprot:33215-Eustigmatos_ZCMA.PRE.1